MEALVNWVRQQVPAAGALVPVAGDAGFRRYFRVAEENGDASGGRTLIVMDARNDRAGCMPFVFIADLLLQSGLRAPRILAKDLDQGLLLLEDLGTHTYLDVLNAAGGHDQADALYSAAIEALVHLQNIPCPPQLPCYDAALLRRELALFPDWYLEQHLKLKVDGELRARLDKIFDVLVQKALAQPTVLVHRDFMPRNLLPPLEGEQRPGLLDFQDAVCGPISYDVICLFKDAFISWPEARVVAWLEQYWQRARSSGLRVPDQFTAFYADCDFMGAQRHLKVIGIFARLCYRDGKSKYLDDAPRFLNYLRGVCTRRSELAPLGELLDAIAAQTAA
jgi:aminoglycoside/choline kinase family phosphotransferase